MLASIIFWAFVVWATIQCGYALYFIRRVFTKTKSYTRGKSQEKKAVSIVICAKNEEENLKKNLPFILRQKYSNTNGELMFEVVVVNDGSTDGTAQVLKDFQKSCSNLKIITIPADAERTLKGKKFAMNAGVEQANHDWLLLTDADCFPNSDLWLQHMVTPLAAGKEIVAGYGGFYGTNSILNAYIRWETVHAFTQYSSFASSGKPYMAVGRNMACTRSVFQQARNSPVWNVSPSGDDDLLVNICGTPENYAIVDVPNAFTYTTAPHRFTDWVKQKQRHLTDGKSYKPSVKRYLSIYGFTHAATWFYFIPLLFTHYREAALGIMALRSFLLWLSWEVVAKRLKEKSIIFLIPFFDFAWMLHNFAFLPYIIIKNKQHWK